MDSILSIEKSLAIAQDSSEQWREIIQSQLVNARHALNNWRTKVTKEYPQYQQIIFHPEQIQIADLQNNYLQSDQSLLTYHVADKSVYGICINRNGISFKKIGFEFDLTKEIEVLRDNVYQYFVSGETNEAKYLDMSQAYTDAAVRLYSSLIEPFAGELKNRITIIPDKALAYLPFDLLLTEEPKDKHTFKTHPYLMLKYAISYCYSVNLWLEITNKKRSNNREILAFAPAFKQTDLPVKSLYAMRSGLAPLKYNDKEIEGISKYFSSHIFSGREATKSHFIENVNNYGLVHLATHSKANDASGDFSYLVFSNLAEGESKLYANEIYSLHLEADLVTLSACESGIGELRNGEGIISLARAFIFAGAKSILSTLWSVNDKSTGELMNQYYRNLSSKMPKDLALQKAKINYLSNHDHTAAHPFFWSGFIMIGDQSPLIRSSSIGFGGVLLVIAVAAFFWILARRRR
jgi:CHAT domain-containing protein